MLDVNIKAPDFTLKDKDNNDVSLSSFLGKKVVVYFYPRDNTPGCTRQAIAFSNDLEKFEKENTVIIAISKDSVDSHVKFATKHDLKILLLSDPDLVAIKAYDVWHEKKAYGKVSFGVVRTSYLIDEKGMIVQVLKKVKPDTNSEQVLAFIKECNK